MSALRRLIAGPAALAWHLVRAVLPAPVGSVRILLFHDVPPAERDAFAALVQGLAHAGHLIGPDEAVARFDHRLPGPPAWMISFDDGFASNAEVARDILDPLGVRALFFVCPGLMDLSGAAREAAIAANVFDGKRGATGLELMNWDEVEALRAAGHAIGNHTLTHRRLTVLSADERAEQVGAAARAIAGRLGPTPWFAYTFGDIGSIDGPALAEVARHHRYCRSGVRGVNRPGVHPLALRADQVDLAGSTSWRHLQVDGGLDAAYRRARARLDALAAVFPLPGEDKLGKGSAP